MAPRTWRCTRVAGGRKCGHDNPRRKTYCERCGKKGPRRKTSPKSTRHLPTHEECFEIFGTRQCMWPGCDVVHTEERKLHRDHDHATMELRGLLCFQHNYMLRRYLSWEYVRKAYVYLGDHEQRMGRLQK